MCRPTGWCASEVGARGGWLPQMGGVAVSRVRDVIGSSGQELVIFGLRAGRPPKAEARDMRPRAVLCEVVGPRLVDVCGLSNCFSS